jgi:hypothetical protein
MHTKNSNVESSVKPLAQVRLLWLALFAALLMSFANTAVQAQPAFLDIRVNFDDEMCPFSVDKPLPDLIKGSITQVRWTAYRNDAKDKNMDFDIFFDPFKGKFKGAKKGVVTSPKVEGTTPDKSKKNGNATEYPYVEFKYTIVGNDCTSGFALDPRLKISR